MSLKILLILIITMLFLCLNLIISKKFFYREKTSTFWMSAYPLIPPPNYLFQLTFI